VVGGLCRADEVAGLSGGQRAGLRAIAEGVAAVAALAAGGGLVAACREALRRSGWPERTAGLTPLERERARRRALVLWALAVAEERSGRATLAGLLERAALAGGDDEEDGTGAVTLATIHQAKGLEWPIVFAIGFTEGSLPHHRAIRPEEAEAIEGERRVAYVAMTRAREELHLSGSASLWGRPAGLSRFLAEARLAGAGAGAADGSTAAVAEEGSTRRLARRACSSASLTVRGAGKSGRLVRRRPRRSQ
jgi:DNA helicase-2/ATP-dependent DNA helicase PcrA